jgi:hypothetical protein
VLGIATGGNLRPAIQAIGTTPHEEQKTGKKHIKDKKETPGWNVLKETDYVEEICRVP